jgi:gamma-glutamyl:cysteine ligase YbdK (ATP-grasp superfamily)
MTLAITTGVELELWVIDRAGELADGRDVADAHPRIEREFVPCLLEVQTEPHDTEQGLRDDLHDVLRTAIDRAAADGLRLVPSGTPLSEAEMAATDARGRLFEEIYGDGVVAAKNCAGSHVHFEQSHVCRQLNVLTALDPALSLVSASPYYRGERNLNCSRAMAYRDDCGTDFRQFCGLLPYVDGVDQWEERTARLYEDFCTLAREAGVSETTVREHFSPADAVLNPVRLQQTQPTVEWRAPDSTLPSHIVALAVDVGSIVAQTESKPLEFGTQGGTDDRVGGTGDHFAGISGHVGVTDDSVVVPKFETVRRLSRLAIRSGCHQERVEQFLRAMGFDVEKYEPLSPHIGGEAVLSSGGARRERRSQSQRLERDIQALRDRRASDPLRCPQVSCAPTHPPSSTIR